MIGILAGVIEPPCGSNTALIRSGKGITIGPESLGENVRLAFIIKDDAIIELYEEK